MKGASMSEPIKREVTEAAAPWLTPEGLEKVYQWGSQGLTDEDIAFNMGLAVSTIARWKNWYPELKKAINDAKVPVNQRVESALYRRAMGYDYEEFEHKVIPIVNADGLVTGEQRVLTKVITKHQPGDVRAQITWLKNRDPEWTDESSVRITSERANPFSELSTEELMKLAESVPEDE